MANKCPNCGWEYGEFDFFCARCGHKLNKSNSQEQEINDENDINQNINKSMNLFLDRINQREERFNSNAKSIFNSTLFGYSVFILSLCIAFALSLNIFIARQQENKLKLQYKNMISKPQLIPELKEPQSYGELRYNIENIEQFLTLYLKYSNDPQEKKEKIFTNYLEELNKIPHISSETMADEKFSQCSSVKSVKTATQCKQKLGNLFKNTAVQTYANQYIVYLYPNSKYIKKKYSKYLNDSLKEYLSLKAKYNAPTSVGLNLKISPKQLADKIYNWEKCCNSTNNAYVKESAENILYNNFRKFIFTPSIYATTTHEMKKEFKDAYVYYINKYKKSNLTPVIMSYLDKQRSYSEENFKNDYPYKIFEKTFEETVEESTLQDIFAQLRNTIFAQNTQTNFKYVYNPITNNWSAYSKENTIKPIEYIINDIDSNGTISIFNNSLSLYQELNVPKYSKLILVNSKLYIFNEDRLTISKINFNSKNFNIALLNAGDITSIFPGVTVVNIDNYTNYNIYLEKPNSKETFIIISKYSQGWQNYVLEPTRGKITKTILPNMFIVDSLNDVEISYRINEATNSETSEYAPTYKFTIHTIGQKPTAQDWENNITQYDETTQQEENTNQYYSPIFKPKIGGNDNKVTEDVADEDLLNAPPPQLAPPEE